MPAHDLDDEGSRVRGRGRVYVVDCLTYPVQRCWCADCKIGHAHVVIDRTDEPDYTKVAMFGELFLGYFPLGMEGL